MNLKEKILLFMQESAYKPLNAEDLALEMEIRGKELIEFWRALEELEHDAKIFKTRYDKYGIPEKMSLVVGRLSLSSKGFGFVIPENPLTEDESDLYIAQDDLKTAMHNDVVIARVNRQNLAGRSREGEIVRIVNRANKKIIGTFDASKNFGFVIPDDKRIGQDIFVARENFNKAKVGAKVVVEIINWPDKQRSAEGKIVEVLGYKGDVGIEILSIIKKHDLAMEFPAEVEQEANKVPEQVLVDESENRRDLRDKIIVTIDGDDAKDLDDAIYIERLANGNFLLGVHIADVSYYVRENTPLDKEARERGTSVYLVDRVLPMLPRRLSNGICSLNAGEDRLAMSIEMEIDYRGKVLKYEIFPSIIKVHTRLTYNIVRQILVDNDEALRQEHAKLMEPLENMERLCHILRNHRMQRGAVDFDFPEIKVKLDDTGKPIELVKRVRSLSESIIEEFMLIANETIAQHMHKIKMPFVFRVHEQPEQGKIDKLNNLLHNFGQNIPKSDEIRPKELQNILKKVAGKPEERIISTVMLRSLKQARYEAENIGHFGLAATYYTHFTSPIRRYPDLIVHRLLRETFRTGDISEKRKQKLTAILPEIALHASQRERAAAEAERETVDLKKVEYMTQFIGQHFMGIINGVTAFGIFVELESGVEGLVRVSSMQNDYYVYVEEQYALIGEHTKKVYRLGDQVEIIVANANIEERNIDFIIADNGQYIPRPMPEKKFLGKSKSAKKNKDDNKQRRSNGNKPKASGDSIIVDFGEAKENKKNYNGIKPKVKSSKKQKKRKPLPHKNKKKK
ncbi:MAG: ribonuclease R [Negativicutes bacterium]|nr:ribonuclease R [Negativicutes bacterium]MBP9949289.1 ribonuclease R [Negativicutes bacterium]